MSLSRSAQGFAATAFMLAGTSFLALTLNAPGAHARALGGGSGGASAPAVASDAAAQAAAQAVAATRQTQESLARAARAMQDIQGVQAAARAAAAAAQMSVTAPIAVPNGLGAGGLLPNAPETWRGANGPTQSVDANGQTQVGIRQTTAQAILDWRSFNVGARTTLTFDQQGQADWVALNRVDRTMGPSQILGQIKADGHVYVINQSGIIFGGNSQVNVGSLIASTAGITESQFLNNGIYGAQTGSTYAESFTAAGGKVVVEAGASISTAAPGSAKVGGGYVLMIGSQVENAGTIATPKGQTILAAGDDFVLRRGFGTDVNQFSTTRGIEIAPVIRNAASGRVINTGHITATQGDITMAGRMVTQDGVLIATTSVNQRGTIHLLNSASDRDGSVTLTGRSFSAILPELESTDTALNSQRDALIPVAGRADTAGQFDNLSALPDRRDRSRIEIVTGGVANFQNGSLTMAQGGEVSVTAATRVFAESGSVIDVSGVHGVQLAMSANQVLVNVQGNELRDSPVNRDSGALINKSVWIDIRDLVYVAADAKLGVGERYYTKGGLLEVGGYLANTGHTIGEWAAIGGTITLAGSEVVAQQGARFNISGGSVSYDGGYIYSSKLIGSDGRIYSFDQAPASMRFIGAAGGFVRTHNIQGQTLDQLTEVWSSIFDRSSSRRWEDGYTVGRDAGRLNLATPTAVMEAEIVAEVTKGERQTSARASNTTDGYKQVQNAAPLEGTLGIGRYDATAATDAGFWNSDVRFGEVAAITAGMTAGDAAPVARKNTVWFDDRYINGLKLGGLDLGTTETITFERAITLADGGKISLVAPVVEFKANVTAHGGSLVVDNFFKGDTAGGRGTERVLLKDGKASVTVHDGVTLDFSGKWVNAAINPADINDQAFVNGGTVTLKSTHDVALKTGSAIDVSSGAAVLAGGKFKGGKGGDVTLIADQSVLGAVAEGVLTLDGDIRAYGVTGGGALKLESGTSIAIGGKVLATDGVLGAGEKAPADLVLLQDYLVKAGEVLPGSFSYQATAFSAGDRLTPTVVINNVRLAADWMPPRPTNVFGNYEITTSTGQTYRIYYTSELPVIPAGTVITVNPYYNGEFAGYMLPAAPFPNGLPSSAPFTRTLSAGTVAPVDAVISAGSLISAGLVLERAATVKPMLQIDTSRFQSGFSSYDINGRHGVVVADGAQLDVAMPIYRLTEDAISVATGAASSQALDVWTPAEWTENARNSTLTQRGGASVTLRSTVGEGELTAANGLVDIRAGALVRVDTGQSISLQGKDITIDGVLAAPGGTISVTQPAAAGLQSVGGKPGLIYIGDAAVLDTAARAVTAINTQGGTYGVVGKAGAILIGGAIDWEATGDAVALDAFVVIRSGALLDASGTSALIDIPGAGLQKTSTPLAVASSGGQIVLKSNNGLYLDGTLRAMAGGGNAAGGTLAIALETPNYVLTTSGDVLRHREIVIADVQGASVVAGAGSVAEIKAGLVTGTARLGADRIKAGGFGSLSLLSDGLISFDGNIALAMNQSLSLYAGVFALSADAQSDARISLAAPYMRLSGVTPVNKELHVQPVVNWLAGQPTAQTSSAVFSVAADLLDIRDRVVFGGRQLFNTQAESYTVDRRGFALLDLLSRGDIRMLGAVLPSLSPTALLTPGNIDLTAAQIYPETSVSASITAGYRHVESRINVGSVLNIRRYGEVTPDLPYSVFGRLTLTADTINQGGVVRAPLGSIAFGSKSSDSQIQTDVINLLPGSISSTSAAGLVMPYGGTMDGITYNYAAGTISLLAAGGGGGVGTQALHLDVQPGAVIDVSGGGELTGAGFISGRGGSVNVLNTAFANSNPGYTFSAKGNEVYALVPGHAGAYAPATNRAEAGFGLPAVGRQVTIPDGVPGLAAGTYTLMPATYALLPGAYRVEIGSSILPGVASTVATGNGSYLSSGYLGVANTTILSSLPNQIIVTPGTTVRAHSSYNEMGYNAFAIADAARLGVPRPRLTVDAGSFGIGTGKPRAADGRSQFQFNGELLMEPEAGSDGYRGTASIIGASEILAAGQSAGSGFVGGAVYADEINKLNAARLLINAEVAVAYGANGRVAEIRSSPYETILRSGAHLAAAEVIIGSAGLQSGGVIYGRQLTIEEGASISTLGRGRASFDSRDGYVFTGDGVLVVSNGFIDLTQAESSNDPGFATQIAIGGCVTASCNRTTTLVSEGTIGVATVGAFSIASNVSYGTRNLVLAMSAINLGDDAAIAAAAAAGRLPAGLQLNQGVLSNLLAGNTAIGAPALETLALNARNSVNVFGSVTLDATKVGRFVFGTPAIYGYGDASDVATIRADEFVWTGAVAAPGAPITDMLGDSKLNIAGNRVVFGYGPNTAPNTQTTDKRITLGFTDVTISATEQVTSNNKSTLGVYHQRGAYDPVTGYQYSGGNLTIASPLVTGAAASSNIITAGGDIRIVGTGGAATPVEALGAKIELKGTNVSIDTSVVLPSGRLVVTASGDIVLGDSARLDLSGRAVQMFDVTKYSWGGDLVLTSTNGNLRQESGSFIDLSAQNNRGGTATFSALGSNAGGVALNGTIRGSASGQYDAGGTLVPYDAAEITVQAQTLADFAGLNARLNAGEVFGARRFQIKQGDLTVGNEVKARNVEIVLDGGSLTVNGTIDASGVQVGSIRLAVMNDLTINGRLDAHATSLRFDSYGLIIDAPNRATVDLTSRDGMLTLTGYAAIDLRAGTDVAVGSGLYQNDGVARGTLALNAPRRGTNDIAIDIQGAPSIAGAKSVAVYGYRTYDDAPVATAPDVTGHKPQEITQAYLDTIHGHSTAFINAALGNGALSVRLAGLGTYHLRPGVDIVAKISADNPNGDLTIPGDLDLSGYRYGPNANAPARGYGEPGAINFRASGNLNVRGSINDGFTPPPASNNDNGWVLDQGVLPYGGDLILPIAVTLDAGSVFKKGAVLDYNLQARFVDQFGNTVAMPAGTVLPVRATLVANYIMAAGVVGATVYNADGTVRYAAGTVLADSVTLTAGMHLGIGTVLRADGFFAPLTWPKGVPLPINMTSTVQINFAAGARIPTMTDVKLPGGTSIQLRTATAGRQGANWAVAPMLGAGTMSWDMQLTAGADLGSADVRARNTLGSGSIVLGDTHHAALTAAGGEFRNLSQAGATALIAALGFDYPGLTASALIGKSESEIVMMLGGAGVTWRDFVDAYGLSLNFWQPSTGNIELGVTLQGATRIASLNGGPPPGYTIATMVGLTRSQLAVAYQAPANTPWADFGVPSNFATWGQGNLDVISMPPTTTYAAPSFSVIRTGTGDLSLTAAGDIRMESLYGVYTAGTALTVDAAYNRARGMTTDGTLLGSATADNNYKAATDLYQAWYPDHGGNVAITAGGNLIGDIYGKSKFGGPSTVLTGNWLWRQGTGTTAVDTPIPTSWWINFGTYVANSNVSNAAKTPDLVGFTGIGALGGGNVAIRVGGEAGTITLRGDQNEGNRSQGLVVAVGSTGRVGTDGSLALTGGGDIDMRIAGQLNPQLTLTNSNEKHVLTGSLIDLRGALHLNAESIGGLKLVYGVIKETYDPRGIDPFNPSSSNARSGITLVPGDSVMTVETRGDLVLGGAGDPGRSVSPSNSAYRAGGTNYVGGGESWFSLWTDNTAINLIAAGGNLTPSTSTGEGWDTNFRGLNLSTDQNMVDGTYLYPPTLRAAALNGSIYYGLSALSFMRTSGTNPFPTVTLAPSLHGTLEMMAGNSIYAGQYGFTLSGTGTLLPTPFNPAFASRETTIAGKNLVTNGSFTGTTAGGTIIPTSLFVFGPNTATIPVGRAEDADPVRFYAGTGDVLGLLTGEILTNVLGTRIWYSGSGPLMVRAGRDIVGAGLTPGAIRESYYDGSRTRGDLIVHSYSNDVSVLAAGRDIMNVNFDIAGPGALEIYAGRNIYQADKGAITSLGAIVAGDVRPGVDIAMLAGVGVAGPDYKAFAARYLDPANLAVSGTPLADQAGKVAKTYETELAAWLKQRYGFAGSDAEARAYLAALAPEQQHIFLRDVYFAELKAGGREYNDTNSARFGSYLRGREAIATLFPERDAAGQTISRNGDITTFSGEYTERDLSTGKDVIKKRDGALRTLSGGDIRLLAPGGQIVIGVEGLPPTDKAGLVTQGAGDIEVYAQKSLLLGLSRIMTTFGGNILAWSSEGDINAGRGSKTTTVYTPPKREYDKYGRAKLSSQATSAGAGIATLNPLPEIPAGDIDLIAPLGTIDAGEAGIRVSGNVNLAALQIINAANIQVQGSSAGIPTVQAPSISASLSTSNAAAASQQTAAPQAAANNAPSVIIVEVLGYGGGEAPRPADEDEKPSQRSQRSYNHDSAFQVVGVGELNEAELRALSETERKQLATR